MLGKQCCGRFGVDRVGLLSAEAVSKRVTSTSGAKVDPPECFVSASRRLGKGKATPENRVISSFDTASASFGHSTVRPDLATISAVLLV